MGDERDLPDVPAEVVTDAEIVQAESVATTESRDLPDDGGEAFLGLLMFVERVEGSLDIRAPHGPGTSRGNWLVRVVWRPLDSAREQACRGEDTTFNGACVLCRGLLAHGLASGNFAR